MPRASLTAVSVEKLRPPRLGQIEYYDRRLPGFGLRLSHRGSKSWFLMTRVRWKAGSPHTRQVPGNLPWRGA